jgi:protein-disulfide isomerase
VEGSPVTTKALSVLFLALSAPSVWVLAGQKADFKDATARVIGAQLIAVSEKGAANARVTIIEFSDFECPFCARVAPIAQKLLRTYPDKVRFIFKNNPLSIHSHALLAHEAALAAGAQGKFWEMHDLLFASQQRLERGDLLHYAKQLHLDLTAFTDALDSHLYRPLIEKDLADARGFGVGSTPTFFVNGTKVVGAQSLEALKAIVDKDLGLSPTPRRVVTIGQAPVRGSSTAPVTVVEFSDFQCPYCARALPTVKELLSGYPGKIKWVFKSFPLDFHADASLAHQAALAAGAQGNFWEMHDRIFAKQRAIKHDDLVQAARDLGLDVPRFIDDIDSGRFKAAVEEDKAEGARLGVQATPTFFINGEEIEGALPVAKFREIVDRDLGRSANVVQVKTPPPDPVDSVSQGPKNAPVTFIWFSDLQSPLSPKAAELVRQVMSAYPGKVRLVFKNRPLEFHVEAALAHQAALAAGAQGKFWEMHDLILANQKALAKEDLVRHAVRLGLDRERFEAALDAETYAPIIAIDLAEARKLGVFGVPVFFINGKRIDGLQAFAVFTQIVDAQLKQVSAAICGQ